MKTGNKFFAELFGTFVLVFGGCGAALFGRLEFIGVAVAFGLTVIAMAYGIGHISGAHLNPAVSFGVWVNGRMSFKEMLVYWAAQIIGGIIAGALLLVVWKSVNAGNTEAVTGVFAANGYGTDFAEATMNSKYFAIGTCGAFLIEALLTFVFLMVILGVTDSRHANGKFGGLAIGLTLTLIHLISIPLTNTSVNPARSLGVALFSNNNVNTWCAMDQLWLFIVAPLVGACLAGIVYKCISGDCCCKKCEK